VTELNSEHTHIDFDLHGMNKPLTAILVIDHLEGTPPLRRKHRTPEKPKMGLK
jgi:hypothetical protein